MSKGLLMFALMIACFSNVSAQFTLSGEIRPRLELRHGYRTLPPEKAEMAAFVNQRSRINLLYQSDQFTTFVSFQDVRTWGGKGMFEVEPGMGIHQAYAEIPFWKSFSVKAGRQELRYNNQRLFGINNWNQVGRTHDAAVLKFSNKGWNVHLGGAFNQTQEPAFGTLYSGNDYKSLNYLWIDKKINHFNISSLLVFDGTQDEFHTSKVKLRATVGGVLIWKPNKNSLELHYYNQRGRTLKNIKIDAWYLNLLGRFNLADPFRMNIGLEVLSGNDQTETARKEKAFNTLYGANHVFNGHLDYFTNIPQHTKGAGLVNPYLNLIYDLNEKISLKTDYHLFALHNNLLGDDKVILDKFLGMEVDLSVQITFSKQLDLQFGYSTMFATESMEFIKGGSRKEPIHWGWVMLTVKPVFFNSGAQAQ